MDSDKQIVTDPHEISETWRRNFHQLLNVENQLEPIEPSPAVEGPVPEITIEEIQKQLWKMKNKSCGPDVIPTESLRILDKPSPDTLCQTTNKAFQVGIPLIWRTSYITGALSSCAKASNCTKEWWKTD